MRVALTVLAVLLLVEGAAAQGITMRMNGDIIIPRETVHRGPALTMNGRIIVDGTLRGDALTMNGDITVSGTVTGDVRTMNGDIFLSSTAVVGGDVTSANGRVERTPGAQVRGRISGESIAPSPPQITPLPTPLPAPQPAPPPVMPAPRPRPWEWGGPWSPWSRIMRAVATMTLIGFVVLAALVTAVFPRQIRRVAGALVAAPGEALLAGLAVWILLPPLAVVLAISIVGIPIAVSLPFLLLLLGLVGTAGVATLVGERIVGAFQQDRSDAVDAVVGAALLGVLAFIPGIGWLAILLATTWGAGAVVLLLMRRVREPSPSTAASP